MSLHRKIQVFLKADNKFSLVCMKVWTIVQGFYYRKRFEKFGSGSRLFAPDRIIGYRHINIGGGVSILHHSRIESIERYEAQSFSPSLLIGDRTFIGQNFHVVAASKLRIGNDVTISGNVYISDCLHEYREPNVHVLKQSLIVRHTEIGDNCFIGYGAVIQPGVILGKQCIVGSNAVVLRGKYPEGSVLAGVPAKIVRKYNSNIRQWESVDAYERDRFRVIEEGTK